MRFVKQKEKRKEVSGWLSDSIWDVAQVAGSVVRRLTNFCLRLGGKVEDMPFPSEFGCDVDPDAVIRHFDEFKKLAYELHEKSEEVARAYFGKDDAYFFIHSEEAMAGFALSKEFTPIGEAIEDLADDVERQWYEHMRKHGLEPEFHFIPDFRWGTSGDAKHQYIDLEAQTPYPDLDILRDVAEAMLEFKKELEEKISRYGAVETKEYR